DGIRDFHVTGVQTCALPISLRCLASRRRGPSTTRAARGIVLLTIVSQDAGPESLGDLMHLANYLRLGGRADDTSLGMPHWWMDEIGRASCRGRVSRRRGAGR